jgi:NAD(P)H-dependent FMN reductase
MTSLVGVVGSVTPPGRLRQGVEFALAQAAVAHPGVMTELVDLGAFRVSFADGRPLDAYEDDTATVVAKLQSADAVLLATPVYRATFTGALKNLLDLTPLEALQNKPVGIVAMGATLHHYLGADWQLRAVLSWFGALTLPTSVYLDSSHFSDGRLTDEGRKSDLGQLCAGLLNLALTERKSLGPPPLAAPRA